jgi:hypothetical protein
MFCLVGFGQTIKPVETEGYQENITVRGVYFKDVNNVLDKFVGTWKYEDTSTNTIFEITFSKVINQERIFDNYADELSAQFKLSINGVEQYNTYNTTCPDCFIASGFESYEEGFENDEFIYTEPNVNMYVGAIAEPNIEQHVLSSNLKLEYQFNLGNPAQLTWTNKVEVGLDYNTNVRINNYQMPMNMVLIRQ